MERRGSARVSEAQWNILMDFLENHPNLARSRRYNNSARGRAESARLWEEVANILNAEGSGTMKNPKEWSIYVSNYKSKLKKIVAEINTDVSGTGGGPARSVSLSDIEQRFLAVLGPGFGQAAPSVSVNPFIVLENPSISSAPQTHETHDLYVVVYTATEETAQHEQNAGVSLLNLETSGGDIVIEQQLIQEELLTPADGAVPAPPRQTRRTRLRTRPLAPLDEARRILSQVEMQRAASDAAHSRALQLIGQNLRRLADAAEKYLLFIVAQQP